MTFPVTGRADEGRETSVAYLPVPAARETAVTACLFAASLSTSGSPMPPVAPGTAVLLGFLLSATDQSLRRGTVWCQPIPDLRSCRMWYLKLNRKQTYGGVV